MKYHASFERLSGLTPESTGISPKGSPSAPIHALLFDVYGTLFISGSGDIGTAEKKAQKKTGLAALLHKYGLDLSPDRLVGVFGEEVRIRHEIMKKKGVDFPEIVIEAVWKKVLKWTDIELVRQFAMDYELAVNPAAPMPGLFAMLEKYRSMDAAMGIISNAQFFTPYLFRYFCGKFPPGLGINPDLTIYSYKFGYAKPSFVLFHAAETRLATLEILPENTLYIGNDMLNDIYPASACGFQTALFAGDARSLRLRADNPDCLSHPPDMVITALDQIPEIKKASQGLTA
ncbi:MAG: HAD family hydrolase [Deltaproteobacteria bacterium]|nr:HAD family hydrolase [Deltaproteobacteria bacterium]